jgi:hypothetical protein
LLITFKCSTESYSLQAAWTTSLRANEQRTPPMTDKSRSQSSPGVTRARTDTDRVSQAGRSTRADIGGPARPPQAPAPDKPERHQHLSDETQSHRRADVDAPPSLSLVVSHPPVLRPLPLTGCLVCTVCGCRRHMSTTTARSVRCRLCTCWAPPRLRRRRHSLNCARFT